MAEEEVANKTINARRPIHRVFLCLYLNLDSILILLLLSSWNIVNDAHAAGQKKTIA